MKTYNMKEASLPLDLYYSITSIQQSISFVD